MCTSICIALNMTMGITIYEILYKDIKFILIKASIFPYTLCEQNI